jgi:hypothetical protein
MMSGADTRSVAVATLKVILAKEASFGPSLETV